MSGLAFFINPMAKRFTDTKKWNDDWYLSLSNDYRVVWQWLLDNCSHAGLCKRSIGLVNIMCRTNLTEEDLIEKMEGRLIIHNDYWFIPKFIKFQYSTLLSSKPAIIGVVKELIKNECTSLIPEDYGNDYRIIPEKWLNHYIMIKDKDKDKVNNSTLKENNILRGQKISENFEEVYFSDGSSQKNGPQQQENLKTGYYKAKDIVKGSIY